MSDSSVTEIAAEARSRMDLRERLMGITRREKTVTVFTNDELGRELGGAEDLYVPGTALKSGERRRWGVAGELDALAARADSLTKQIEAGTLSEEDAEPILSEMERDRAIHTKRAKRLVEDLKKTSFSFTLRAVPEIVIKDARRQARQNLGITKKGTEGREQEFADEFAAVLLTLSVASWVDHETGVESNSLSLDEAHALKELLPYGQFPRLDRAMAELSMESQIAESVTSDLDF